MVDVSAIESGLPLLCMAAVFLHHRWRMHSRMQSAWKGGGFAMFSDIQRNVVVADVWLEEDGRGVGPVHVQGHRALLEAAVIPTPDRLAHCGRELLHSRWHRSGDIAWVVQHGSSRVHWRATRIRVRHLRLGFDAAIGRHTAAETSAYVLSDDVDGTGQRESR